MRVMAKYVSGRLILTLCLFSLCACESKKDEIIVIPPATNPLSGGYVGFGVITASFTHITSDPDDSSPSIGYLRKGSIVKITRRQNIKTGSAFQSWVLIDDGDYYGWLKEEEMDVYDNEGQANTASRLMLR
jgi:hypothetical protein